VTLTAKDVAEILRILEESSFDRLSLEMDGVKLNLQRGSAAPTQQLQNSAISSSPSIGAAPPSVKGTSKPPSEPGLLDVPSPLLGIFYSTPKPGEPPFVHIGSKLEEDTVIGIIEVMKLMNSVRAGLKGQVVEILVENGAAVEYGEILMRVRPEA
jgi:acetyl-CoA carboxylase biotin carboxyl carrier protein